MGDFEALDVMVSHGCGAPLSREQALELFDELERLAGFERRVRELFGEVDAGDRPPTGRGGRPRE